MVTVMASKSWSIPMPVLADTGLEPACLIAGRYFAVGAHLDGDELEAVRLFIEQIVGPESAARWTEAFRTLPSSLVVLNGDLIQQEPFMRMSATQMLAGRSVGLSTGIQTAMEIMSIFMSLRIRVGCAFMRTVGAAGNAADPGRVCIHAHRRPKRMVRMNAHPTARWAYTLRRTLSS